MTNRERMLGILKYEKVDRLPIIHFGFWPETIEKWVSEGHISKEEVINDISGKLGFDSGFTCWYKYQADIFPKFERQIIKTFPDGSRHTRQNDGVVVLEKNQVGSIPSEIEHLLVDRKTWEEYYLPRLQFSEDRVDKEKLDMCFEESRKLDMPISLNCGSMLGKLRNWLGLVGLSYLQVDDEDLLDEMIDTMGKLSYETTKFVLEAGYIPDMGHFWEDMAYNKGPLVNPVMFQEKCGHYYKKVTTLLDEYGCQLTHVDCDGDPSLLVPMWLESGVNIITPIEVGTWNGSYIPLREKYGKELRGAGGMRKAVFAEDYFAVDKEIERLSPIIEQGGFIPMPDHRIVPDAKWENVQYYCDKLRTKYSSL